MGQFKKILINFDNELLKRIDDFRFKNRFNSRAETIRFLIEWALKQNPKP